MRKKGAKICLLAPAGLLPCLTMPRCATRQLLVVISAKASGAVSGFRNAGEVTLRTLTGAGVTGLGQTAKPKPYPRFQHFNFLTVLTCALDVLEEAASKSRCPSSLAMGYLKRLSNLICGTRARRLCITEQVACLRIIAFNNYISITGTPVTSTHIDSAPKRSARRRPDGNDL